MMLFSALLVAVFACALAHLSRRRPSDSFFLPQTVAVLKTQPLARTLRHR